MKLDGMYLHLVVNHFPIVLGVVGLLAAVAAAILRRDAVWRYACVTLLLAAATAPLAYFTGEAAEDPAGGLDYVDTLAMDEHAVYAQWAFVGLGLAGVAAFLALVRPSAWTRASLVVVTAAALGFTLYTAFLGGKIVHYSVMLE